MAGNRKSVKIGIKFPSQAEANKDLKTLLDGLNKSNKIKLDLDISSFNKSLGEMSKTLDSLKSKLAKFNILENVTGDSNKIKNNTEAILQQNDALKEQQKIKGEVLKNSTTTDITNGNESVVKDLTKIKDEYGNIVEVVNKYNKVTGNIVNTTRTVTDEVEKNKKAQESALASIEKYKSDMQSKLNVSSNNSFIDVGVIDRLQDKLNSINTNSSEKELKELGLAIKTLSSSDSSIVRVQNAILKMENSLTGLKGKYGSLVGNSSSINQLKAYENELNNLRSVLNDLTSGKTYSSSKLTSELNKSADASKKLSNSVKDSSNALKIATKDAITFSGAMKSMFAKVGLASMSYQAINMLKQSLKDGVVAVRDMDSAITTLKITMADMSNSALTGMVKQSQQLATNLSSTTSTVLEAVKTFANMGETIDSIMNKTSSAVVLTNLTGRGIQDSVNTIQSATKQFDALADGSEASSMKVADSMVAISKSLGMDFSTGVTDMSASVGILGSLANQMKMDLDETLALISAGAEKLRISGSEVATSMKTIMTRTMRIKGEDATEDDFKATEKALNDIGIKIRDLSTGEMRGYMDVLKDINAKWDTLSEAQQMALGEAMGKQNLPI